MPMVHREGGLRLFFYANEGDPREPPHVHVARDGAEAKFWLTPEVRLEYNDGLDARSLREAARVVEANRGRIVRRWHEFFGTAAA